METTKIEFTRINNDTNGNPQYVCHFLNFINDKDEEEAKDNYIKLISKIDLLYKLALKRANTIGGRKYHNKSYGGGIVFRSYNLFDLEKRILGLLN